MHQPAARVEPLERRLCFSAAWQVATPTVSISDLKAGPAALAVPPAGAFTPAQVAHAYGIDRIKFGAVSGNGAGETIAMVDAFNDPNIFTDLATFDSTFDLPGTTAAQTAAIVHVVNQTGGSSLPPVDNTNGAWELEESEDVEWAHAIAPAAKLLLVECSSANFTDLIGAGVNYARHQPGVVAVSMSFDGGENPQDPKFDPIFTTPPGHAGVTFTAATGDTPPDSGYPAVSPNVLAVGGTKLFTSNSAGTYSSESADEDSGGGISSYELQPGYQNSVVGGSTPFRTTPDVSFDGSRQTGVAVCDSYDFGTADPWNIEAGSSLGSPCWAGLIAIADQGRALTKLGSLDGATGTLPRLYNLPPSDFHDINFGGNGFSAGAGYDLATGRGTPVANLLVAGLVHDPAGPQIISDLVTGVSMDKVTAISFSFSQTMNVTSFALTDVETFSGPGEANLLKQISGFKWTNSNRTLRLSLDALTTNGRYTLVLGPHVEAAGSNKPLDQNFDGIAGASSDTYTVDFFIKASVGPDAFGYVAAAAPYKNLSLTPGGTGVTSILANTDDGSTPVSLGTSTFSFFGHTYTSVFVDSNGFLTFNAGSAANTDFANTDLSSDPTEPTIAPLWDDWTTARAPSEQVLYKFTNPNAAGKPQMLIIEWDAVQNQGAFAFGTDSPATFAVALQLNTGASAGNIVFNYANLNLGQPDFSNGGSATVGLSAGPASSDRLLISLDNSDNPLVATGKSILIAIPSESHTFR